MFTVSQKDICSNQRQRYLQTDIDAGPANPDPVPGVRRGGPATVGETIGPGPEFPVAPACEHAMAARGRWADGPSTVGPCAEDPVRQARALTRATGPTLRRRRGRPGRMSPPPPRPTPLPRARPPTPGPTPPPSAPSATGRTTPRHPQRPRPTIPRTPPTPTFSVPMSPPGLMRLLVPMGSASLMRPLRLVGPLGLPGPLGSPPGAPGAPGARPAS